MTNSILDILNLIIKSKFVIIHITERPQYFTNFIINEIKNNYNIIYNDIKNLEKINQETFIFLDDSNLYNKLTQLKNQINNDNIKIIIITYGRIGSITHSNSIYNTNLKREFLYRSDLILSLTTNFITIEKCKVAFAGMGEKINISNLKQLVRLKKLQIIEKLYIKN